MTTSASPSQAPLTLESLCLYASGQTNLIKPLCEAGPPYPYFKDTARVEWKELRTDVWGKALDTFDKEEEVQRGLNIIDDPVILPDGVPSCRNVMIKPKHLDDCLSIECKKSSFDPSTRKPRNVF